MRWAAFSLVFFLMLLAKVLTGQDVIVTLAGDSIYGQVVETNDQFVYYRTIYTKRGKVEVIARKQVAELLTDQTQDRRRPAEKEVLDPYDRFSFFGGGGVSWLSINRLEDSDEFDGYYRSLQWGRWFGFGASYMIDRNLGVGFLLSRSQYGSDEVGVQAQNGALTGVMREDITIDYAAANLIYRLRTDRSGSGVTLSGGIGLTRYQNEMEIFYPFHLEGYDVGLHARGIYRLCISPGIYLPIELGVRGITVGTIDIAPDESVPEDLRNPLRNYIGSTHPANIARLEVGVGLEISF